ncbi:MAG: hypothetical protein HOI88_06440 [Phycisphaerae bacterium]|jgi:aspartate-semialdehyde dehydrogenase|nr:hypothetical protein [Phycisphaerae bacterium]MBT5366161.1 hypothetical protein [Phycisphaerae bacterium]MBT6269970.1 hypothetical protein [Phycisphaerae bacterium]MBT6281768.1 hypothetical protein [Phycisphaerae bacterium]
MKIAVIGARGLVGRACVMELQSRGIDVIELSTSSSVPDNTEGVIVASAMKESMLSIPLVDCTGELSNTSLVLPNILCSHSTRVRIPNCMASLIAQAIAPLHRQCSVTSIIATCMQSASGAGWRGVKALEEDTTEKIFGGTLTNNILPHENAKREEEAINSDLNEIFGCTVTTTSFRVPVSTGHVASLRIETKSVIDKNLLPVSDCIDPRSLENKRSVSIGRVRVDKNTADIVICGNQLICGTAIPAVTSILST